MKATLSVQLNKQEMIDWAILGLVAKGGEFPHNAQVVVVAEPEQLAAPTTSVRDLTDLLKIVKEANRNQLIPGIKLVRQMTGLGLKEAKEMMEVMLPPWSEPR